MSIEDEINEQCLKLIKEANDLHVLAEKSHCKSEAKRYRILAEAKQEEANKLLKNASKDNE